MKIDSLLAAGFGVAGVYYGDIDPDFNGGIPFGVRALYLKPGQAEPAAHEWGAIAAWAWGLSRAVDYLETDTAVDAKRVSIFGISRLGKTVMWAGARDTRIAMVIASCSGEGGAALSRRNYGETIAHLTAPTRYPYQFCANYGKYAEHPEQSPVDANLLVAWRCISIPIDRRAVRSTAALVLRTYRGLVQSSDTAPVDGRLGRLPRGTPSFFTPLARRILAVGSALKRPPSAAS
jgi:hypothetical protein